MGRIVTIANQKGGVGKTTTAINLSACLAAASKKVLLIDLDPQGNATSGIGLEKNQSDLTLYDALIEERPIQEIVQPTLMDDLKIAPGHRDMVGAEVELIDEDQREFRLKHCLNGIEDEYDYVFIDCPPSLGLLTLNGLVAAKSVLSIPDSAHRTSAGWLSRSHGASAAQSRRRGARPVAA